MTPYALGKCGRYGPVEQFIAQCNRVGRPVPAWAIALVVRTTTHTPQADDVSAHSYHGLDIPKL